MAWYPKAVRKELPQNATQLKIRPVGMVLHTAVSDGISLFNFFNGRSAGVESHFYIREDGTVEQYMDTTVRADCQLDGNSWLKDGIRYGFLSIESWDGGHPETTPWNAQQLAAIVALIRWAAAQHGWPIIKATGPQGTGVGYHAQFTDDASDPDPSWNHSHSCPAALRIAQVPAIISAAKTTAEVIDMSLSTADVKKVWTDKTIENRNDPNVATGTMVSPAWTLTNLEATQDKHNSLLNILNAQVGALKGSLDAVTAALAAHAADSSLDVDALITAVRQASEDGAEAALSQAVNVAVTFENKTP